MTRPPTPRTSSLNQRTGGPVLTLTQPLWKPSQPWLFSRALLFVRCVSTVSASMSVSQRDLPRSVVVCALMTEGHHRHAVPSLCPRCACTVAHSTLLWWEKTVALERETFLLLKKKYYKRLKTSKWWHTLFIALEFLNLLTLMRLNFQKENV